MALKQELQHGSVTNRKPPLPLVQINLLWFFAIGVGFSLTICFFSFPSLPVFCRCMLHLHQLVGVLVFEGQLSSVHCQGSSEKVMSYISNALAVAAKQLQNIL